MRGVFDVILVLLGAFYCHVGGSLGRFGALLGSKKEPKTIPKTYLNLDQISEPKIYKNMPQNWLPQLYQNGFLEDSWPPAGLLGRFLATSRPSLSLLDPPCSPVASPEAFLDGSWGPFGFFRGYLWSFSAQFRASLGPLGPLGRFMGSARTFFGAASGASSAILSVACKLSETAGHSR